MKIEYMSPEDLIPYEQNAKIHPPEQVEHIANSIKAFGWQQPIVIDKDNVVVIGHGRLLAAKSLMLDTVPVTRADELTEEQIKALRLADNKTNESPYDIGKLDLELAELSISGFDMEQFGFELVKMDEFSDDFALDDGEKKPFQQISITVHDKQAELIHKCIKYVYDNDEVNETSTNENHNGNGIYEVVRQWAEQKNLL